MKNSFDPVAALEAYHAAIAAHDIEMVATMLAADATYASVGLGTLEDRPAIVAALWHYFARFPDHKSWDNNVEKTAPRKARSTWQLRATDRETGKVVERHGVESVEFNASGLIIRVEVEDQT